MYHKAGRGLDALVGTYILQYNDWCPDSMEMYCTHAGLIEDNKYFHFRKTLPYFSTRMQDCEIVLYRVKCAGEKAKDRFEGYMAYHQIGYFDVNPHNICLAALYAYNVWDVNGNPIERD